MSITKLHASMTKIALALFTAASSLALSSCQDEDYGYSADQIAYQTNFQKAYGNISEIPTWDLSSYNLKKLGLEGGPSNDFAAVGRAKTRAQGGSASNIISTYDKIDYFKVDPSTVTWLNDNLAEKVNNSSKGVAFTMLNPYYDGNEKDPNTGEYYDRDFLIIPIYQGASAMTCDLHIVDEQFDYNVWSKSQNLRYTYHFDQWEEYSFSSSNVINFNEAFKYINKASSTVWVSFTMPVGSLSGRFYLQSNNKKAYITDVEVPVLSSGRTIEQNKINITEILKKSYSASDGTQISANDNLTNLYFEPSDVNGVDVDPYPADRLHVYVKIDNPTTASEIRELKNFKSGSDYYVTPRGGEDAGSTVSYFQGHTIERHDVESKVMKINTKNLGRSFYLYLETTYTNEYNEDFSHLGVKHRSDGNPKMMLALTSFQTANPPINLLKTLKELKVIDQSATTTDGYEFLVVGCEDANGSSSDWDYNDVVLLFVGMPKVPKVAKNVIKKRYMIEDLGSTFDFDFNDIVVDVTQEEVQSIGTNADPVRTQTVSISHLCGTIPFEVYIGGESVFEHAFQGNNTDSHGKDSGYDPTTDPDYGTKYVKTFTETTGLPWEPNTNNITIYVWPKNATPSYNNGSPTGGHGSSYDGTNNLLDIKDAQQINFPKPGEFPYIIAVDQDINWMPELNSVPRSWFYTTESDQIIEDYDKNEDRPNVTPTTPTDNGYTDDDFNALDGDVVALSYITDKVDGTTTIDLGALLKDRKYRDGKISLTVALNGNCSAEYTEVKGSFESTYSLPIRQVTFKNFETTTANGKTFITQNYELTSDEFMNAAYAGDLKLVINYATYGFKDVNKSDSEANNPRARLLIKQEDSSHIHAYNSGSISSAAVSDVFLGTEVSRYDIRQNINNTSSIETDNNNSRQQIRFGKYYGENYTADQKAYVTFVVPAGGKITGKFRDYDTDWFDSNANLTFDNSNGEEARAFTVEIGGAFRRALAAGGAGRSEFRFEVISATGCTADPTQSSAPQVGVYVNWDGYGEANKKSFSVTNISGNDNLVLSVDGSSYTSGTNVQVLPGANVKVSAHVTGTADDQYRVAWLDASNNVISTSLPNETAVFTINENTAVKCHIYYKLHPQYWVKTGSGEELSDYSGDDAAGYAELTWNGQTVRDEIYVPAGAEVTLKAVANNGYTFKSWWGYGSGSSFVHTMPAKADWPHARFTKQTTNKLSVNCTDIDFEFVFTIDDVESPIVNAVNVAPNSTVKISVRKKAESSLNIDASNYRVQWNSNGTTTSSSDYKSVTLTMPSADVSIDATLLYCQVPVVQILNGTNYEEPGFITDSKIANIGSVTLTYNGQSVINQPIYVPVGASYTASVSAAAGYTFKEWRYRGGNNNNTITVTKSAKNVEYGPHAVFVEKKITVTAVVSPSGAGFVTLNNNKNQESGTNTLSVQAGDVDFTATPNANDGYRFYTWGWGRYDNPRTFTWSNQLEDRAIYAYFATEVEKSDDRNWELQNNYEYLTFDGKNTDKLSSLGVDSQLVFFFEDPSGTFDAATFTFHEKSGKYGSGEQAYQADKISGATVVKINDQKLVVVTLDSQDAVNYIKSNGFKLRVTGIEGKKVIFRFFGIGKK